MTVPADPALPKGCAGFFGGEGTAVFPNTADMNLVLLPLDCLVEARYGDFAPAAQVNSPGFSQSACSNIIRLERLHLIAFSGVDSLIFLQN